MESEKELRKIETKTAKGGKVQSSCRVPKRGYIMPPINRLVGSVKYGKQYSSQNNRNIREDAHGGDRCEN